MNDAWIHRTSELGGVPGVLPCRLVSLIPCQLVIKKSLQNGQRDENTLLLEQGGERQLGKDESSQLDNTQECRCRGIFHNLMPVFHKFYHSMHLDGVS
jgi:hypothetical protein